MISISLWVHLYCSYVILVALSSDDICIYTVNCIDPFSPKKHCFSVDLCFTCTHVLLLSAPHMLSLLSTRPRCHCRAGYSFGAVTPWPLQCCSCGFAGDNTSPSTESLACSRTYHTVLDLKLGDHVTLALRELHWLPITERIQYKLCLLVHKMFGGHAPDYIASLLMLASDIPSRSSLHSSSRL